MPPLCENAIPRQARDFVRVGPAQPGHFQLDRLKNRMVLLNF